MNDNTYIQLLDAIKARIKASQNNIAMYVNSELLFTYWHIGDHLNQETNRQAWGAKVVDQLAKDLKISFPSMKGLSKRNLQYMMKFAAQWPLLSLIKQPGKKIEGSVNKQAKNNENTIVPPPVAQLQTTDNQHDTIVPPPVAQFQKFEQFAFARIPWSHHRILLDKINNMAERNFYCEQIVANSWSKSVLLNKVEQNLYANTGKLSNNFTKVLSTKQAILVKETFKDPYFFDFLQLSNEANEKEIQDRLTTQISEFLLELGAGFAYMGRQYKLEVGGKEYYLDLLFFHTKLNCYVNIELKIDEFKPEYAGKSQFYLTAIDEQLKETHHNTSVGIILCKTANKVVVEYTLKQTSVPLGVAAYKLVKELPGKLKGLLPSPEQLKASFKK